MSVTPTWFPLIGVRKSNTIRVVELIHRQKKRREELMPETYTTGTGQHLVSVHEHSDFCDIYGCPIHAPSDHHMKNWPTNWRSGGILDIKPPHFERICQHGVGHPDPDSAAFLKRNFNEDVSIHGCDGCCKPERHLTLIQGGNNGN